MCCEKLQKTAKNCECVFHNRTPLKKHCKNLRNNSQISSVFALPVVKGNFPLQHVFPHTTESANIVKIPPNAMLFAWFSPYFCKEFCCETHNIKYNSHFSLVIPMIHNFCFRKSRRCASWWATSIMATRNGFASELVSPQGLPRFLCWWKLYPFLDSKLFWQPSCTHLYTRITCFVADISGSEPWTLPEVTSPWQLILVHNCWPDRPPGSRKIESINR